MWEILGISPTTDITEIKKAYARQLKSFDMNAEPKRFQELRQAYEVARMLAGITQEQPKRHGKVSDEPDNEEDSDEAVPKRDIGNPDKLGSINYNFLTTQDEQEKITVPALSFEDLESDIERLLKLVKKSSKEKITSELKSVLKRPELASIENKEIFETMLAERLLSEKNIQTEILQYFIKQFHWKFDSYRCDSRFQMAINRVILKSDPFKEKKYGKSKTVNYDREKTKQSIIIIVVILFILGLFARSGMSQSTEKTMTQDQFQDLLEKAKQKMNEEGVFNNLATNQKKVSLAGKGLITKVRVETWEEAVKKKISAVDDGEPVYLCLQFQKTLEDYAVPATYDETSTYWFNKKLISLEIQMGGNPDVVYASDLVEIPNDKLKSDFVCINLAPGELKEYYSISWLKAVGKGSPGSWSNQISVYQLGRTGSFEEDFKQKTLLATVPLFANVSSGIQKYSDQYDSFRRQLLIVGWLQEGD